MPSRPPSQASRVATVKVDAPADLPENETDRQEEAAATSTQTRVPELSASAAFHRTSSNLEAGDLADPVLVTQGRCEDEVDAEASDKSKDDSSSDGEFDLVSSNYSCSADGEDDSDTDLDFDTEAWARGIEPFDSTGLKDYVAECERLGTVPVTYFLRHSREKTFSMKYHGLGPLGTKAIAKALELNLVTEKIDLEGNNVEAEGAICLANVLKDNYTVTELVLSENLLRSDGAQSITSMLLENSAIQTLDLAGNCFRDCDGCFFQQMLSQNTTLQKLSLKHNEFAEETARGLCEALAGNEYLKMLDLSWNHFMTNSADYIADIIKDNYGLKYLNLAMNGLADEGALLIGQALKQNLCLVDLNLSNNRITQEGAKDIARCFDTNEVLETLRLGQNPIGADGAASLLDAIHTHNNTTALTLLDIMGVVVNEAFDKLHEHVNTERTSAGRLHVLHGGVLFRNKHIIYMGEDEPEEEFQCDPLTKLRKHAEKAKYRLIDVFRQFDSDHNWALSKEELIKGGESTGMNMTEKEVDLLIKQLDKDGDGEIDYDELMIGETELRKKQRRAKTLKDEYDAKVKEGPREVEISLGSRDEFT